MLEYAFHTELNISVLGEQAQRMKLLSKVILHISGEMPSLYLTKKKKTPKNSFECHNEKFLRISGELRYRDTQWFPVWYWLSASRVRKKNTTTTSGQPGLIKHWFSQSKEYCSEGWLCGTAKAVPALESRRQRMKGKKLNSTKIILSAQDGRGKEAIFSAKQCSQNRKATSEIWSVLRLTKLLLCSAAPEPAWHLLSLGSFNWWAVATTPSSVHVGHWEAEQCWPTLPIEHYDSWQHWPLWLLNPRALWRQWPRSHKSLDTDWIKPQFHSDFNTDEGDLHQSHMALQVIYWTTDMSLWCPASSFHISQPMEFSTPFPGGSNNSKQSGSRLSVDSSSTPKHFAFISDTMGYHHCMLAPACIPNLWNEFICRDF